MNNFVKDPNAVLDYKCDWSSWLADNESISTYSVTVADGIASPDSTFDSDSVTFWLSGGTLGNTYNVDCQIQTNSGRTDERTIRFNIRER